MMDLNAANALGLSAAFCTTAAYIPQAVKVWRTRSTHDVSLVMFIVMVLGVALWLLYGLVISDKPLIIANGITLLLAASILICKLRFG